MKPDDQQTLIFYLREARSKAAKAARLEALCVLKPLEAYLLRGGPLSDRGGVFWVSTNATEAALREIDYPRLGYSEAVDLVVPIQESAFRMNRADMIRFRGKAMKLDRLYERDPGAERERDPDQRLFHLMTPDGGIQEVRGYRGDGSPFGRRALPVCDAQLLVNLVNPGPGRTLLDPFAGAGGIVQESIRVGLIPYTIDIDPILTPGLVQMGSRHMVGDATNLPFPYESLDAVATEPPFSAATRGWIIQALEEMIRVLRLGGRLAIYCADWQAEPLRTQSSLLPLQPLLDVPIDRKGSPCHILAWEKREW
jgi:SAM-dependent methyltransferase